MGWWWWWWRRQWPLPRLLLLLLLREPDLLARTLALHLQWLQEKERRLLLQWLVDPEEQ